MNDEYEQGSTDEVLRVSLLSAVEKLSADTYAVKAAKESLELCRRDLERKAAKAEKMAGAVCEFKDMLVKSGKRHVVESVEAQMKLRER